MPSPGPAPENRSSIVPGASIARPGVSAVLLAAGESTRMGRPKPLLPWEGTTLVQYQVASLLNGGVDEVCVVTGAGGEAVESLFRDETGVRVVPNPDYKTGKTTSVRAGVRAVDAAAAAIVILAADQPRPDWVIRHVVDSHLSAGAPVTSPRFQGRGGHPLVFSAGLRQELLEITEAKQGIREVVRRHADRMNLLEFESRVVRLDINTPDTYAAAIRDYGELSAKSGY